MQSQEIIKQFNEGVSFIDTKGRRILAVAEHVIMPALIVGEDEDDLGVKIAGVDYYSAEDDSDDFWDIVLASDLKAVNYY